ncbi:hypothetical protein GCM10025790_27770 [Nesterenkonia rhizosphaerae]|uniref:ATP synthase protein I n=1 Tax=Nesterenkonia rhizosphaerae TaxID=1348272 RepID=A0ABP9GD39_9MICC
MQFCFLFAAVAAGAAGLFAGWEAAASASIGGGTITVLAVASVAVVHWADRTVPEHLVTVYLVTFVMKLLLLGALLALPVPQWVERGWAGMTAIVVVLVWQGVMLRGFTQLRHTVSPDSSRTP